MKADLEISGTINSNSRIIYKEFKYLSDSRRHWRESIGEILSFIKSETDYQIKFSGSIHTSIDHFCSFSNINSHSITWIKNQANQNLSALETVANVLVITKELPELSNKTIGFFHTPEPKAAFFSVLEHFWGKQTATVKADGFGYFIDHGGIPQKVRHFDGVEIVNDVEIGAYCCIDRGTLDNTVIGNH